MLLSRVWLTRADDDDANDNDDSPNAPKVIPPQSVFLSPDSFAVLGPNGSFRNSSSALFNPTKTAVPFFQIFNQEFLEILGDNPSFHRVAQNTTFAFAHEAPIYVPETDEVFFGSNDGGALGQSDLNRNNKVGKISMAAVETALQSLNGQLGPVNVPVTELDLPDTIQMTNGGTGPLNSNLVLITSGRGTRPPSVALVNPHPPFNATVLLDNFFGRQFNSLNDAKIHPKSGAIFFTDNSYGFVNRFRGPLFIPPQVYRLDPVTRAVRVVATDFNKCNGVAFDPEGKIAYVTDTGAAGSTLDQTLPATIYAYDVDEETQTFMNRRVFAYADTGIPDGVQVDADGNVYAGCGDGVQVWSKKGVLLGKFFIGTVSANMAFAGDGRLVILAETAIYVAKIAAKEGKVKFP
ncbi:hypothetical protein CVT24_000965 [Panaeolus cyanescens]|uniref:SMP-30/Gluconolactonase/LRE-like region domain-containing protein n=1 Tax=Panaeolus cyanescens TaxID=181874 RepID=A0A409YCC9_9AGAR|nr:hypothetical protein CVT24_000965 [Panaeolus cyanescens]